MIKLNDFMDVCDDIFVLHLDFVCDFEEITVIPSNRQEVLKRWDGLEIKNISNDFDMHGNECLLVSSKPIQCEDF